MATQSVLDRQVVVVKFSDWAKNSESISGYAGTFLFAQFLDSILKYFKGHKASHHTSMQHHFRKRLSNQPQNSGGC